MISIGDQLFAMTEWLRTTSLIEFSLWLSTTPASEMLQSHFYLIPLLQTVHILTIAVTFGSVLMFNLRILGVTGSSLTVPQTAQRYAPWVWWGLLLLIVTGIGMIVGEPVRELINPVFWIKMAGVIGVILASLWFQRAVSRRMGRWDKEKAGHFAIRAGAVALIVLWLMVMVGGRWIAYAPT